MSVCLSHMRVHINLLLFSALCFVLHSCNNQEYVEYNYSCEFIRRGKLADTFMKEDVSQLLNDSILQYTSLLHVDSEYQRDWLLRRPQLYDDRPYEYVVNEKEYSSKLIGVHKLNLANRTIEVFEYRIDEHSSIDEESNKFYVEEYGVIVETFWKRNCIKVVPNNNKELNELIDLILHGEGLVNCIE